MDSNPLVRRDWFALVGLMLGFAVLFGVYYPPIAGVEDEVGFLNQALVWSRGAITAEGAGFANGLPHFIVVNGQHVASRHPGRSLIALPFLALGGVPATFASGLLIHEFTTLIVALVLIRLGRSPLWAVLILFHPTLALFSRTIMADSSAGACLLLASLALLRGLPIGAGLAVGLAAAMRYHSALALPIFALAFLGQGAKGWRNAVVCLASGGVVGLCLVGYNLAVYGAVNEPFTRDRSDFGLVYLWSNVSFYVVSLMVVWPLMLLVPAFDRSPLRWVLRAMVVIFLGPLLFYYFHDVGSGHVETWIVGQRLIQVALPVWVVSYAVLVDQWIYVPVRRILGGRTTAGLVMLACLGLLVGTDLIFSKHQRHLETLRQARDAIVASMPAGSVVVYQGALDKILGTPGEVPEYRLRLLEFDGKPNDDPAVLRRDLERETKPWFLGILHKPSSRISTEYGRSLIDHFAMERVDVDSPLITLYIARPRP